MANGYFREDQSHRLGRLLDETKERGLFRLVMLHHPPVRGAVTTHKRLLGIARFQSVIQRHGADLILHGHSHVPSKYAIRGADGTVPVIGVAAAGQAPGGDKPAAQYNMFEIAGEPGNWSVAMKRRGLTGLSTPVTTLATEVLVEGTPEQALAKN